MLLGVLDIGSNSAQLQVFEVRPGAPPLPTHAVKEPTLLGEAFDPDGCIDLGGVDRVIGAVNRAMNAARRPAILGATRSTAEACAGDAPRSSRPAPLGRRARPGDLQTTHNESFDLPLRPLLGTTYQRGRPAPAPAPVPVSVPVPAPVSVPQGDGDPALVVARGA